MGSTELALPPPGLFWRNVLKTDTCWLWQKHLSAKGYGRIQFARRREMAHRVAWALTFGELSSHLLVCHTCDNPRCVNPDHLFLGTALDNMRDAITKGRLYRRAYTGRVGTQNGKAILTDSAVREIRSTHGPGISKQYLADRFRVSKSTIKVVLARKTWKHVT